MKRKLLLHASKALPAVDIPVYGSLSQTDLPPNQKLIIIIIVTVLKFLVILFDYETTRKARNGS